VENFGFIMLGADNGGDYYSLKDVNKNLNLNYEFAKTRVIRNADVKNKYEKSGTKFSPEVQHLTSLSNELLESAKKNQSDAQKCAQISDKALEYALWAGEKIELERAASEIQRINRKDNFHFGCESRQMIWAKSEEFTKRFPELFNFATVTHYVWDSWYELFEPTEGRYNWGVKDDIVDFLVKSNIEIEGRPLFWFHPTVTPDWLKTKNYDELKQYMEKHIYDLVTHYKDNVLSWEVFNEYHDWANIFNHSREQTIELTRLAFEKTKEVNPKVVRILNNCCPWAEYAAMGRMARMDAARPLRSPRKFIEDLVNNGVDFDVLGIQIYFPRRDLSDIVRLLERLEKFNKPIYITELGASSGYSVEHIIDGQTKISNDPYEWHRRWDEELQADWLEQVYSIYYSRPSIKAVNWYDFTDFRPFIVNGGLAREDVSPKLSFFRLKELLTSWNRLPEERN
jgi:GH35 family endo-1,4-beta-xylanase